MPRLHKFQICNTRGHKPFVASWIWTTKKTGLLRRVGLPHFGSRLVELRTLQRVPCQGGDTNKNPSNQVQGPSSLQMSVAKCRCRTSAWVAFSCWSPLRLYQKHDKVVEKSPVGLQRKPFSNRNSAWLLDDKISNGQSIMNVSRKGFNMIQLADLCPAFWLRAKYMSPPIWLKPWFFAVYRGLHYESYIGIIIASQCKYPYEAYEPMSIYNGILYNFIRILNVAHVVYHSSLPKEHRDWQGGRHTCLGCSLSWLIYW